MISEGSCDTEVWSIDAGNPALTFLLYFLSNKCSLGEHKISLSKTLKNLTNPKLLNGSVKFNSNPGSMKIRASKQISGTPLLRTLLHVSKQYQSEMSSEWN